MQSHPGKSFRSASPPLAELFTFITQIQGALVVLLEPLSEMALYAAGDLPVRNPVFRTRKQDKRL